jgi:hypothetical protein
VQRLFIIAALALYTGWIAGTQSVVGDWQGTLKVDGTELRLVLHIAHGRDGALKATLDSVDQGQTAIPVSSISIKPSKMKFTVESVNGSYEGTFNDDASVVSGTWSQGRPLPLDFKRAGTHINAEQKPAKPSDIDGGWTGIADAGGVKLRIVFHITNTEDGLVATMDSPDQGVRGIPVTSVKRNGASLTLELRQ